MISGFSSQDGDNNLDICLDMGEVSGALQVNQNPFLFTITGQEDFVLTLHCEGESRLYPPKGKPFGCLPHQVTLYIYQYFKMIAHLSFFC